MSDTIERQALSKEEAIKAHPNLSYEFEDVRKAATFGFGLALFQIIVLVFSSSIVEGQLFGVLLYFCILIGLSYLILHKVKMAVVYYIGLIALSTLSMVVLDIAQDDFGLIVLFFKSIPLMIVVGVIQPAYSSINKINEYVENPKDKELYFRGIKYCLYGVSCWIIFGSLKTIIYMLSNILG